MKNIFSKEIYKQNLKKLSLVGILTLAITLITTILLIFSNFRSKYFLSARVDRFIVFQSDDYTAVGIMPILLIVIFIAAPLFTYLVFRYQNKRALADKHHSLPYTNTQQFVSRIAAVMTAVYAIIILTALTAFISLNITQSSYVSGHIFPCTLAYMAGSTLAAAVVALAMSFTGNLFANMTVSAVILLLPQSILFLIGTLTGQVSQGFVPISELGILLNHSLNIPVGILLDASTLYEYFGISYILINTGSIVYTFVLSVIYLAAALFLFRIRKSELAGKSFDNSLSSYVFAALCTAPIIAYGAYFSVKSYTFTGSLSFCRLLLPALFSLILFLIITLIYNAKFKGVLKGLSVFAAVFVLITASIYIGHANAVGQTNKTISVDDVSYIQIDLSSCRDREAVPLYTYGMLKAKEVKIYDHKIIERMISEMDTTITGINTAWKSGGHVVPDGSIWCEFHMKNQMPITRYIHILDERSIPEIRDLLKGSQEFYSAIMSLPEYEQIDRFSLSYPPGPKADSTADVALCVLTELEETNNEGRVALPFYLERMDDNLYPIGYVTVQGRLDGNAYKNVLYINDALPKSKKMYMESVSEYNDVTFNKALDFITSGNTQGSNITFNMDLNYVDYHVDNEYRICYNSFSNEEVISTDVLYELCDYFKDADYSNIYKYSNYAKVYISTYYQSNGEVYDISAETYIPLSEDIYKRCVEISLEYNKK